MRRLVFTFLLALPLLTACDAVQYQALKTYMSVKKGLVVDDGTVAVDSGKQDFTITALADDMEFPWGFDFLPDGRMLITEKAGRLRVFDPASGETTAISGVPEVHYKGQGGLLDVLVHPDFADNQWVYLSASVAVGENAFTTRVTRYRLNGEQLANATPIFEAQPAFPGSIHFGSAMLFDNDGYLFITMGDRKRRHLAQDLSASMGKVMRYQEDGSIPQDNPFVDTPGALPEIYTYGHRNPQGITIDRAAGRIWTVEHGPKGGDEINLLRAGANYGWPIITYGEEYAGGKIGEGTEKEGLEQPVYYYVPSIATGGMAWYDADALPGWRGSLFVAGLRSFSVSRVALEGDNAAGEERLLEDFSFRVRNLKQGPDGLLYVLTENGGLHRIGPAPAS
ncbi:MAG: PQQ-dependent sugar dehydrogenase [Halioglobus sp.]|nr:PQQ-dependent sugar dehydrogenase [Halioglobus sp.]